MFSTVCNENRASHGFSGDIIELCLAHKERNSVRASYNFAKNLEDRRALMQWYSDYLCGLCPKLREFSLSLL